MANSSLMDHPDIPRKKENLVYAGIWLIVACLYIFHIVFDHNMDSPIPGTMVAAKMLHVLAPCFVVFLVNNYLLIPRLLTGVRRHTACYVVSVAILVLLTSYVEYLVFTGEIFSSPHPHPDSGAVHGNAPPPPPDEGRFPMPIVHGMIYLFLTVGANVAVALIFRQMDYDLERQCLINAHMESQLSHLKEQINPHFYLNMLNNIHGLIEVAPERARQMVFDMSQLMRYMLYDSACQRIPLASELKFLRDYMRVMEQRFPRDKVSVTTLFPTDNASAGIMIPPLLFLAFIENAFKHGVSYRSSSFVAVAIEVGDATVRFTCINSMPADGEGRPAEPSRKGIGLSNVRKRLNLLYGSKANLDIESTSHSFKVNLTIPIYDS